jgi:hypothetical protein
MEGGEMTDCERPCLNEFVPLVQIEQFGDGVSIAAGIVQWLCEAGRAGRFVHVAHEGFSNYEQTCALEDALIDAGQCEDWTFVVGTLEGDGETKSWLEYRDEVVVPYGDKRKSTGSDVGVWRREDFDAMDYTVQAVAPAGPESGITLNAIMKSLGHGLLGEP